MIEQFAQQWRSMQGHGPHAMQHAGEAFASSLSGALEAYADQLAHRYGIAPAALAIGAIAQANDDMHR